MNKPATFEVATNFQRRVYGILGLPFDAVSMEQAQAALLADLAHGRRNFFSTPNLNFLVAALEDAAFRDSVLRSDLSIADGMPIVWVARLLRIPVAERVAGSTLFERLRLQQRVPLKVFFFGGPDGVAAQAAERLNAQGGGMRCVGARSPGFGSIADMSTPALIAEINDAGADLLVVALGAKRGQSWIEHNLDALRPPLVSHLGAVVNFVAGTVTRAPGLVGSLGLEWLWRVKEEPALWRRYYRDGLALLRLATRKVLPAALAARRRPGARVAPELRLARDGRHAHLTLSGDWLEADLPPLRDALTELGGEPVHLTLDLAQATRVDAAAIGLLMLLFGHQSKRRAGFCISACSAPVAQALRLACADYLLDTPLGAAPAPATSNDLPQKGFS